MAVLLPLNLKNIPAPLQKKTVENMDFWKYPYFLQFFAKKIGSNDVIYDNLTRTLTGVRANFAPTGGGYPPLPRDLENEAR